VELPAHLEIKAAKAAKDVSKLLGLILIFLSSWPEKTPILAQWFPVAFFSNYPEWLKM
jgi:hypothetical protein